MYLTIVSKKNGNTYYLNSKEVALAGARIQRIYYFSLQPTEFSIDSIPEGYEAIERVPSGIPVLRKIKK